MTGDEATAEGELDAYLFPEPELRACTDEQLYALIRENLPDATAEPDGTDLVSDVAIDHAQDLIEQARDLLLSRGAVISPQLRATLRFLSWPLSPDKTAANQARQLREIEEDQLRREHAAKLGVEIIQAIRTVMDGGQVPAALSLEGVTVEVGWCSRTSDGVRRTISPSGAEVVCMRDALIAAGCTQCRLSGASQGGVPFEDAPTPEWGLSFSVPLTRDAWDLLKQWWQEGRYSFAPHVWLHRREIGDPDFFWHWSLRDCWPAQAPAWHLLYGHLGYVEFPWVRFHRRVHGNCWDRDEVRVEWAAGELRYIECTEEADREAQRLIAAGETLAYPLPTGNAEDELTGASLKRPERRRIAELLARVWGVLARSLVDGLSAPTKNSSHAKRVKDK